MVVLQVEESGLLRNYLCISFLKFLTLSLFAYHIKELLMYTIKWGRLENTTSVEFIKKSSVVWLIAFVIQSADFCVWFCCSLSMLEIFQSKNIIGLACQQITSYFEFLITSQRKFASLLLICNKDQVITRLNFFKLQRREILSLYIDAYSQITWLQFWHTVAFSKKVIEKLQAFILNLSSKGYMRQML